jgi:K+-transporting ATPase KdpF subunit
VGVETGGRGMDMLMLLVSVVVGAYLFYAMVRPENF